jgi:hypothetical protein
MLTTRIAYEVSLKDHGAKIACEASLKDHGAKITWK